MPPSSITAVSVAPANVVGATASGESASGQAVHSAKVVSLVTLVSRLLGLARDVACAAVFGASWVWDAFVLAFLVPNLFRRLFGEGSLSAAFIPVYTAQREHHGPAAAVRILANLYTALVLGLAMMSAIVIAASVFLPDAFFAPFFGAGKEQKLDLFRELMPVVMPFVVIICATALLGGALNVHGRFFVPAFAPALQNIIWLLGVGVALLVADGVRAQVMVVAGAVVLGAAVGFLHHVWALRREYRRDFAAVPPSANADADADVPVVRITAKRIDTTDTAFRDVMGRMGPTVVGLGFLQLSVLLDSLIAEAFVPGDGAVSALYFGNRLMQFPLALIGVAMGIAVFPVLARYAARGETGRLRTVLHDCTRITLFLSIPACVGLVVLSDPIIEVIFRRGNFGAEAQARTALVLACYGIGVIASCVRMLQTRAFFAIGDTRTPVRISLWVLGLNLVLNLILVHTPLREGGLALSTALTTWASTIAMSRVLGKKLVPDAAGEETTENVERQARRRLRQSAWRSTFAAVAMTAAIVPLMAVVQDMGGISALPVVARIAVLGGIVTAGMAVYLVASRVQGAPELAELRHRRHPAN